MPYDVDDDDLTMRLPVLADSANTDNAPPILLELFDDEVEISLSGIPRPRKIRVRYASLVRALKLMGV